MFRIKIWRTSPRIRLGTGSCCWRSTFSSSWSLISVSASNFKFNFFKTSIKVTNPIFVWRTIMKFATSLKFIFWTRSATNGKNDCAAITQTGDVAPPNLIVARIIVQRSQLFLMQSAAVLSGRQCLIDYLGLRIFMWKPKLLVQEFQHEASKSIYSINNFRYSHVKGYELAS